LLFRREAAPEAAHPLPRVILGFMIGAVPRDGQIHFIERLSQVAHPEAKFAATSIDGAHRDIGLIVVSMKQPAGRAEELKVKVVS
jgi:hypothetical protein